VLSVAIVGFLIAYLVSVNPSTIRVVLVPELLPPLPLWALLVGAFLSGAFFTLVIMLCRDIRRAFDPLLFGLGRRQTNSAHTLDQPQVSGERSCQGNDASEHYSAGKHQLEAGSAREAIRHFREALRRDRHFGPAHLLMGDAHERLGERKEAIRTWERGVEQTALLPLLLRLEQVSRAEGRPSRMIALYQNALSRFPHDHAVAFHLGRVYFELSMLDEAREQFLKIETALPGLPSLHAYLGAIFERRGQARQACQEYENALQRGGLFEWPYICSGCGLTVSAWSDRCGGCGRWNSFHPLADSEGGTPCSPLPALGRSAVDRTSARGIAPIKPAFEPESSSPQ
jgi:hypothetical protein